MTPKRIQRQRTKGWTMPEGAIYVGRPTRWGNWWVAERVAEQWKRYVRHLPDPDAFVVVRYDKHGHRTGERFGGFASREDATRFAVELHRRNLLARQLEPDGQMGTHFYLSSLRGHDLACWCPLDQPCHADVLLELANGEEV